MDSLACSFFTGWILDLKQERKGAEWTILNFSTHSSLNLSGIFSIPEIKCFCRKALHKRRLCFTQ